MGPTVLFHRTAILELVRGPWRVLWLATPAISKDAALLLLPHLQREDAAVRILAPLTPDAVCGGQVDLEALLLLRALPNCDIRSLPDLTACLYAAGPGGPALVSGAALTVPALDSLSGYGVWLNDGQPALEDLALWWAKASRLSEADWVSLTEQAVQRLESRRIGAELAKVGAFVRVSYRGSRRTRRLDPRDFGAVPGDWGRVVRPVEVALYKLDDVIRAKEELEAELALQGLEWNGHYLVPRHYLEREWPRLFANKERQLRGRLQSPEGEAALKEQLKSARRELEAFFGEIFVRVPDPGMPAEKWVEVQTTRVLAETVSATILEESGLEYRVLSIVPEDPRTARELDRLLQDPRLRSVQLTFQI